MSEFITVKKWGKVMEIDPSTLEGHLFAGWVECDPEPAIEEPIEVIEVPQVIYTPEVIAPIDPPAEPEEGA